MWKHHTNCHGDNPPKFSYKIIKHFKTALERQIFEAVHLKILSSDPNLTIMNSKGEYTRCHLPRLIIEGTCNDNESSEIRDRGGATAGGQNGRAKHKEVVEIE